VTGPSHRQTYPTNPIKLIKKGFEDNSKMAENSYAHHFSIANIPFGIASSSSHPTPAAVTRISNDVIFLDVLYEAGLFQAIPDLSSSTFSQVSAWKLHQIQSRH
jgi:hypothetical protein